MYILLGNYYYCMVKGLIKQLQTGNLISENRLRASKKWMFMIESSAIKRER